MLDRVQLRTLADTLINDAVSGGAIVQGNVEIKHRPPYRQLDCDGRALAYVRLMTKKHQIRVEVSGLWLVARPPKVRVQNVSGLIGLVANNEQEIAAIVEYLRATVARTRAAYAAGGRLNGSS